MRPATFTLLAAVAALATTGLSARPSRAEEKCPAVVLQAEAGRPGSHMVVFTLAKAPETLDYNWTVSNGTIVGGQRTTSIMVDVSGVPSGQPVTAVVDLLKLDPACPAKDRSLSATAKAP
jgi:hypothetical protein